MATTFEDMLDAIDEAISEGVRRGVMHNTVDDRVLDGRTIGLQGRSLVNFGSCSYLGLETHPAMKAGVSHAVETYGTQFSSSRAYVSAPGYREAESLLAGIFGRPTTITPSTSLGHLAALPALVGARDVLIMDHQVHRSVQTAAALVQQQGCAVELVRHQDTAALEERLQQLERSHRRVWFAADGLYSMFADFVDVEALNRLTARYPHLWLYLDDAHSVSWSGRHGRGHVLESLSPVAAERAVVAASLNKSFAAAGGALTFPDEETRRRVFTVGGPMIFSGPVQPPMLGAIAASARLHLTAEVAHRQRHLADLILTFNRLAQDAGLPLASVSLAPIRFVGAGLPRIAYHVTRQLLDAGLFVDTAVFPAVAAKRGGTRVSLTAHHTEQDVERLVEALVVAVPRALREEGSSPEELASSFARHLGERAAHLLGGGSTASSSGPRLHLEAASSVDELDTAEWDQMFAGRGCLDSNGLRMLERAFASGAPGTVDHWRFDYWVVRDDQGRPVAATFATTATWKDDMLSGAELSAKVERVRQSDPWHLTSTVVSTGSLLTEGDHLYLDRSADWRAALRLLLATARDRERQAGASSVVVRDVSRQDQELQDLLLSEGFSRVPMPTSWVRPVDFADDAAFLDQLTSRSRHHQRRNVLAREQEFAVQVVRCGPGAELPEALLEHLHGLYLAVQRRSLELNVFPLPSGVLRAVLVSPGWELILLRLREGEQPPVAFVAVHTGAHHVQPVFLGLDYDAVVTHGAYQQALWQSIRAAQRLGASRVLFGMSADRHKARFGSVPERRDAWIALDDDYQHDELGRLAAAIGVAG